MFIIIPRVVAKKITLKNRKEKYQTYQVGALKISQKKAVSSKEGTEF